jgi:hypothetical protein
VTPQSNFTVAAPIVPGREAELRALLESMNRVPGLADPDNLLFPFGAYERLHMARFVILRDETLGDLAAYGASFPDAPIWLAFLGDCDGAEDTILAEFAGKSAAGLRQIFAHTAAPPGEDLLGWMRQHSVRPAAQFVNWVGRTVRQVREEATLRVALRQLLDDQSSMAGASPAALHQRLRAHVARNGPRLTQLAPTPFGWLARRLGWLALRISAALALAPLLLLSSPVLLWMLRRRETRDPVITPRPNPAHVAALNRIEDHEVTNQFSAFGSIKPGVFRRLTLLLAFQALEFSTRFLYTRGRLARVGTIHFARWVFLDGYRRVLFASNYDGSADSYMDDFINKAAFGLNLVFSNGVGWPRTRFLLAGGAREEQPFKNYFRRHQLPTQVWYKAYPGLTAADLATNTQIREGLERARMSDAEARRWLTLI